MSLPRYEEYKDSGVEWLGQLPAHWVATPIKVLGRLKGGAGFPHDKQGIQGEELEFFKVNSLAAADFKGILQRAENTIAQSTASRLGAFVFPARTVVFAKVGAALMLRRVREMPRPACIDNNMMGLMVSDCNDVRFVRYAFDLVHFDLIANPGAVPSLNEGQIGNYVLGRPPREEQAAIATFLDHETAKIDALIAEQEKLIALLAEKRQTTISHAVTRGLNPDAPMKDSGVPWLGEVPAHWQIGPLKRFAEVIDCKHHTVQFLDEGFPIVSIRELRDDRIDLINAKYTSKDEWDFLREGRVPQKGDLIFCRNASVGAVGYVDGIEDFCMGQDVCLIRPKLDGRFMHLQMCSSLVRSQIESLLVGATIRRANVEEIRSLVVVWPSEGEQQSIADFIQNELLRFRGLADQARSAVNLLQERRSALIAAAVTGQIDVRGAL